MRELHGEISLLGGVIMSTGQNVDCRRDASSGLKLIYLYMITALTLICMEKCVQSPDGREARKQSRLEPHQHLYSLISVVLTW